MWPFVSDPLLIIMFLRFIHVVACISTLLFYYWIIFFCVNLPHSPYPFISWWTFELFLTFWLLYVILLLIMVCRFLGRYIFSFGASVMAQPSVKKKKSACNAGDAGDCGFNPWVRKIPWRREWQLTLVFLLEESHGQRNLAGYSPWGHKESDMTEGLSSNMFL